MSAVMNEAMHKDHLVWRSDNSLWCDELRNWRCNFHKVKGDLSRLESYIEDHERGLANHAAAIRFYEEQLLKHEHAMACCEEGVVADEATLGHGHEQEAARHREQLEHHKRIKAHHYKVIKHWKSLLKAFQEAV